MGPSHLAVFTFLLLLAAKVQGSLLDGLEHHHHHGDHAHGDHAHGDHAHGDHGHGDHAHGDHAHEDHGHGDHAHGDHAHGDHAHGDHANGDHAHGDHSHGDHAHGDHANGDHAHGEHAQGDHPHGDDHSHDHEQTTIVNQDLFANALASELGGGFLDSLPINDAPASAPAETFVAPAPVAPVEKFVAPAAPSTTEFVEVFITSTTAPEPFLEVLQQQPQQQQQSQLLQSQQQQSQRQQQQQQQQQQQASFQENAVLFEDKEEAASFSSSGAAKQLASSPVNGRGEGDYPEYAAVPRTTFSCAAQETGGYFADPEAECQVFHICLNGQNLGSFLCPNGTLFHQQYFVCDWWFNVDCGAASQSYGLNARIGVVPDSSEN